MTVEADDRGRLYLPKDLRETHGKRFRVLDLPPRVVLIPVDEHRLEAVRDSIGDRFGGRSIEEIREDIEENAHAEVDAEAQEREERQPDTRDECGCTSRATSSSRSLSLMTG